MKIESLFYKTKKTRKPKKTDMAFTKVSEVNFPHITNPVLAIDVERTGCYYKNQTLAVGLALYVPGEGISNYRFTPDRDANIKWETRCIDEFWSKNQDLLKDILDTPTQKWEHLTNIINDLDTKYPNLMICSDNPAYDIAHLNYELQSHTGIRGLYYKLDKSYRNIIDTDSFLAAFDIHNNDLWVSTNQILVNHNLTVSAVHDHKPENDAAYILESFLAVLNLKRASV